MEHCCERYFTINPIVMRFMRYLPGRNIPHLLTAPFIFSVLLPLVLLDIFLEVYHRICFPVYGIAYVKRREYIRIDRHRLRYIPWYAKINCAYCGYANGLIEYARTIAGETEKYWCSIKHKNDPGAIFFPPEYHRDFLAYGDEKSYWNFIKK